MNPGRVIGRVVCTAKYPTFEGERFLLVQPTDWQQNDVGEPIVATDSVGSGAGEFIFYVESREAAVALGEKTPPSDATICGIIDGVDMDETL
ncbi:MAG: EutN/CcmL family microcompartment protein [bacterium]